MPKSIHSIHVLDNVTFKPVERETLQDLRPLMTLTYGDSKALSRTSLTVHKVPFRTETMPFSPVPRGNFFSAHSDANRKSSNPKALHCTLSYFLEMTALPPSLAGMGYQLQYPDKVVHHHPYVSKLALNPTKVAQTVESFRQFALGEIFFGMKSVPDSWESNHWASEYRGYIQRINLIAKAWGFREITLQNQYYESSAILLNFTKDVDDLSNHIKNISRVDFREDMFYNELYLRLLHPDQSEPLFFGK